MNELLFGLYRLTSGERLLVEKDTVRRGAPARLRTPSPVSRGMSQLSLFDSDKKSAEPRPPNLDLVRKSLKRVLYVARRAEIMPWRRHELRSWQQRFPELAAMLGPEEGGELVAAFERELQRLKAE